MMVFINALFTVFSILWLVSEVAAGEPDPALWFALAFTLFCAANTVNLLGGRRRQPGRSGAKGVTAAGPGEPLADRPNVPAAYGVMDANAGEGLMAWPDISQRLATPANYWICTTRPDGRPHSTPVWGVWLDQVFYFGTHRDSAKAHNLAANPYLSMHLDSSDKVIIVEGPVEGVGNSQLRALVDKEMARKYELDPEIAAPDQNPLFSMRPALAYAWSGDDFGASATRWTFG